MPEPTTQRSALEKFGRALQGAGFGMLGRPAPFEEEDLQRERMAQQERQFGQTFGLQKEQLARAQTEFQKTYALQAARTAMDLLKTMSESGFKADEASAQKMGTLLGPVLFQGLQAMGDPKAGAIDPDLASGLVSKMLSGGITWQELGQMHSDLTVEQLQGLTRIHRTKPEAVTSAAKDFRQQNLVGLVAGLKEDLPFILPAFRQSHPAYADPATRIPFPELLQYARQTFGKRIARFPQQSSILQEAIGELSKDTKFLESHGILSPERAAELTKPEVLGTDFNRYAKQLYPKKDPSTLTGDEVEAVNAAIKVEKKEIAAAGVAVQPVPAETLQMVTGVEEQLKALTRVGEILTGGTADQFIGPTFTGARIVEWAKKNLPESFVGQVPDELAILDQAEATIRNIHIRARTGAAVRETEEPRLTAEIPDRTRDKPEVYRQKYRQSVKTSQALLERLRALSGPRGREYLANPEKLTRDIPLPPPLALPKSEGIQILGTTRSR